MNGNLQPGSKTRQPHVLLIADEGLLLFSHSVVPVSVTPRTAARQTLSFPISQSLLKLMSTESVMPSKHLILCHPLLFLLSVFPSIRVFSSESALSIMWPLQSPQGTHTTQQQQINNQAEVETQDLNRHFSKQGIEMANKCIQRCSTSLNIREMQIKTTMRHHLAPARMAIIKKSKSL